MRFANTIFTAQDDNEPTFGHESDKKRDKVWIGDTRTALDPSSISWKCSAVDQQTHTMRS
jgi:hypothetical protein